MDFDSTGYTMEAIISMLTSLKLDNTPSNTAEEFAQALIKNLLVTNSVETAESEAKRSFQQLQDTLTNELGLLVHDNQILKKAVRVLYEKSQHNKASENEILAQKLEQIRMENHKLKYSLSQMDGVDKIDDSTRQIF